MILLDENILENQRILLKQWRISSRQIGDDAGHKGMKDNEIINLLMKVRRQTFFSCDKHFYDRALCHSRYCIVYLDVEQSETALFIRRLLRHHLFDTQAKRFGLVIKVSHVGGSIREEHIQKEKHFLWTTNKK